MFSILSSPLVAQQTLFLEQAFQKALENPINLQVVDAQINSKAGQIKQASLYPNPSFYCEVEKWGTGNCKEWDEQENLVELTQQIELGGKRGARMGVAQSIYNEALIEKEIEELSIYNKLSLDFIDVFYDQEILKLEAEQAQVAKEYYELITEKVKEGKDSLIILGKAEIEYLEAVNAEEIAQSELNQSKEKLTRWWGCANPDFDEVLFPFYEIEEMPCLGDYLSTLDKNPILTKFNSEYEIASNLIIYEKSKGIPDVIVGGGYADKGFIFTLTVPIPVFDRNQGNIASAYANVTAAEGKIYDVRRRLELTLSQNYTALVATNNSLKKTQSILDSAKRIYDMAIEGFHNGKFSYLEVLLAKNSFFDARFQYLQTLKRYHQARSNINYLYIELE